MPTLPSATTTLSEQAAASAGGVELLVVMAAVPTAADITPRIFANPAAIIDKHGYSEGAEYAALHIAETGKPLCFVGLPIQTAGVVGRKNTTGNSDSSVVDVTVAASGSLAETDGIVTVITGGTIGTDQIMLGLSLDGGRSVKRVRLGTANSYTIPYVGLVLSFAAGDLTADDTVLTWHSTAPRWDTQGIEDARAALAAQQKQARSWLIIGDLTAKDDADDIVTEANAYETENDRFTLARVQLRDHLPAATLSHTTVRMTGTNTVTFAEVGGTGDTITRSAGSFITDGFAVGDIITVTGTTNNNFVGASKITGVSATVLTLGSDDLVDEGPVSAVTITATGSLVFLEVGGTGDTITRTRGSWIADGFAVGDLVTVAGSGSNNFVATAGIATLTNTVMTFDTTDLANETIGSVLVTITAGESKAEWIASMDSKFAAVDAEKRIDIAAGRARKLSPITGYHFRRPAAWAASIREYQHDVQIPTWRKEDGPLSGWDLFDAAGNLVEFDERVDGGALAARFTCLRTWANGPAGAFVALSLTRDEDGALLSRTHNMAVANVACTVNQRQTENAIGQVLQLNADGTATASSLRLIEGRVNAALKIALLQSGQEGPRASGAEWKAATDDVLNTPGATLNGVLALEINGTLEHIATTVKVS